ncbi:MAG: acyltransferase [Deltaproteobacteria bacterium]|nr:acyltransferase [Deltaproteobacteria bacterium]
MYLIIKAVKHAYQTIKRSIELQKYNNFTIAEYFRKKGAQIGEGCYIVPRRLGAEPYLVKIGNHVGIMEEVHLHTHDGGTWIFREEMPDLRMFGPIIIEDNCLIGMGAHILPGVTIGRNSIVSAGSVIITDVPPDSIVMGVPARRFGSVEKYREKCINAWKEQKPPHFDQSSLMHYELASNQKIILRQLREHLSEIFKERLSK